jgi:hypothetical protein
VRAWQAEQDAALIQARLPWLVDAPRVPADVARRVVAAQDESLTRVEVALRAARQAEADGLALRVGARAAARDEPAVLGGLGVRGELGVGLLGLAPPAAPRAAAARDGQAALGEALPRQGVPAAWPERRARAPLDDNLVAPQGEIARPLDVLPVEALLAARAHS